MSDKVVYLIWKLGEWQETSYPVWVLTNHWDRYYIAW